ncbi:hypothetical protein L6452_42388 [Arctium lappa]|uniref:Uncharacterized protein n=1 Tax=Arctium lappa TaxID=4217 RepID=A0ACB8XIS9_ARCLA|nr:hypothetical protein L6452_42388 [Arctium lappa]
MANNGVVVVDLIAENGEGAIWNLTLIPVCIQLVCMGRLVQLLMRGVALFRALVIHSRRQLRSSIVFQYQMEMRCNLGMLLFFSVKMEPRRLMLSNFIRMIQMQNTVEKQKSKGKNQTRGEVDVDGFTMVRNKKKLAQKSANQVWIHKVVQKDAGSTSGIVKEKETTMGANPEQSVVQSTQGIETEVACDVTMAQGVENDAPKGYRESDKLKDATSNFQTVEIKMERTKHIDDPSAPPSGGSVHDPVKGDILDSMNKAFTNTKAKSGRLNTTPFSLLMDLEEEGSYLHGLHGDSSQETQSVASDVASDHEELTENVEKDFVVDENKKPKTEGSFGNRLQQQKSKNWSKLKKLILLKRSIKALEGFRKLKPQTPERKILINETEEERVELRRQMMDERKKVEQWMLDYAVQHIVTKLTPARKKRVSMLVEAFKAVVPLPKI